MASPVRALLVLALLGIVGTGLYSASFDTAFHFDDHHSIRENPNLSDLIGLDLSCLSGYFTDAALFSGQADRAMYRPLLLVSYAITRVLAGDMNWVAALHVSNVLLHIVVSWLVWALVRTVFADSGVPPRKCLGIPGNRSCRDLGGAGIFAASPCQRNRPIHQCLFREHGDPLHAADASVVETGTRLGGIDLLRPGSGLQVNDDRDACYFVGIRLPVPEIRLS